MNHLLFTMKEPPLISCVCVTAHGQRHSFNFFPRFSSQCIITGNHRLSVKTAIKQNCNILSINKDL